MEQTTTEQSQQPIFDLNVDEMTNRNLSGAAGWAKFLAIVVFISVALVIIALLSMRDEISLTLSRFLPGMDALGFAIGVIAFAVVLAVVLFYFLINGAILVRRGLQTRDQQTFNAGLGSLKNYFVMYGVITIITILLTIIGLFAN